MLTIRRAQLDSFAAAQGQDFEQRLIRFLRDNFADAAQEHEAAFSTGVRAGVERAESYGLDTEQDIATYCVTAWLLGSDFPEEFPAAGRALVNPEYSSHIKAEWLANWTEKLFASMEAQE